MTTIGNNFKIRKFVDDLEVIDSGVIHTDKDSIDFLINDFKFRFLILKDDKNKKMRIESNISEDNDQPQLTIKLLNFDNPLGSGYLRPTELVEFKGSKIYVTFFLRMIENEKEFSYSLLVK